MVDTENAVFAERLGDGVVDLLARGEVGSQRFFEPDANIALRQAGLDETLDRGFEQAGRGRKEDGQSLVICPDFGRQGIVSLARGGIDGDIAKPVEEFGNPAAAVIGKVFLSAARAKSR